MGSSGTSSSKEGSLGFIGGANEPKVEVKGPGTAMCPLKLRVGHFVEKHGCFQT